MRILQLAPRLPFPLTDGGAIGIYNITRHVAALGHELTLLTYPDRDAAITRAAVEDMSRFCDLRLLKKPLPPRLLTVARTLLRGAYPVERRESSEMYQLISNVLAKHQFDVVHCDHAHMGKYALWVKETFGLPVLLRQHNVEAQIYERFAVHAPNPISRWFGRTQSRRLAALEERFVRGVDMVAAISDEDARIMRAYAPKANIRIVPAGVDLDVFAPADRALEEQGNITWIGRFAWEPNTDAVRYFLSDILPLILHSSPNCVFHIIGAGAEQVANDAKRFGPNVVIHGFVDDVREYLTRASVLVVPLRVGGGMRIKILEFCAMAKAVVSTSIGAEGNLAVNDREVVLRDDPASFAAAVTLLLSDSARRNEIGRNARALVQQHYSWTRIGEQFCELYRELLSYN